MTEIVRLGDKVSSGYFPKLRRSAIVLIYRIIAGCMIVDHVPICFRILAAANLRKRIPSPMGSEFNCTRRIQSDFIYYIFFGRLSASKGLPASTTALSLWEPIKTGKEMLNFT